VEKLGALTHRWRYLVLALEAAVAAGCVYFGSRVFGSGPAARSQVQVQRAPADAPDPISVLTLPWQRPAKPPAKAAPPRTLRPSLGTGAMERLDHDDFELYRRQWQVLQALTDGVRKYIEQRVVPRLLAY
jgi:hypothetical protein